MSLKASKSKAATAQFEQSEAQTSSPQFEMPCEDSGESQATLGMLLVISGPSGVGKDTVWQTVAPMLPSFCKAITCTTRPQREGETEGEDYYFVSNDEFDRLIRDNELLEWAQVHGNRYGVPALPVLNRINEGHDVVCVIDVQGAIAVRGRFPTSLLIFLRPPASQDGDETQTLKQRLQARAPLSDEELARRLKTAAWELAQTQLYDHAIVNEDVAKTSEQLRDIVLREKKRWTRTHQA